MPQPYFGALPMSAWHQTGKIWTDNCRGQYKCNQNFLKFATSSKMTGVELDHRFAQKHEFKGALDATGKVVKHAMRSEELVTRNDKKPLVCE
jgi:high-affinity K+ transport system ATPase subunit B